MGQEIVISLSLSIAAVMGIVEAIKKAGLPSKYAPLVSLALGIAASFLVPGDTVGSTVFTGVVIGLSASGLYSGTQTVLANK